MSSQGASHRVGYGVLAIGILVFLVVSFRGYRDTILHGIDFNIVYSSSKCLLDHCDPYNYKALFQEYTNAGGIVSPANAVGNDTPGANLSVFQAFPALYPPSSIFWVTPFTLLPFKSALALWMTCSALLFTIAAVLIADLCRQFRSSLPLILLGVFVATSTNLVTTGQPSSFAISLCAIGVWSLLSNRLPAVGILCFALSLTLKPQVAGLVLVYFLLAAGPTRRRAVLILVATALLCVPGIVWVTTIPAAAHWPQSIRANLAAGATPGSINDPGPTNFNSMFGHRPASDLGPFRRRSAGLQPRSGSCEWRADPGLGLCGDPRCTFTEKGLVGRGCDSMSGPLAPLSPPLRCAPSPADPSCGGVVNRRGRVAGHFVGSRYDCRDLRHSPPHPPGALRAPAMDARSAQDASIAPNLSAGLSLRRAGVSCLFCDDPKGHKQVFDSGCHLLAPC